MGITDYLKIGVILLYTGFIWYCHGVYDDHKLTKAAEQQTIAAQEGQTKMIEFHQKLSKVYAKTTDKCRNAPIPADVLKLLH